MPQTLPIILDVVTKRLVLSYRDATIFTLPPFQNTECIPIAFCAVKQVSIFRQPIFEKIPLAGYSLQISIGSAGTVLAAQNTFTLSSDGYALTGVLDLNTAGISGCADGANALFEIRLFEGTHLTYAQTSVTLCKSVYTTGVLVPVPTDTALGLLEARRMFPMRDGAAGDGLIFTSADGSKRIFAYCDNAGSFQTVPLT